MIEITKPSLNDLNDFLRRKGKKGSTILSILGKLEPFVSAMQTEVGFEILKDDIARLEDLSIKIYNEQATEMEMAEFRYLKGRIEKVQSRINLYIEKLKEINDTTRQP